MSTYYIDFTSGKKDSDGLCPENARNSYEDIDVKPGDVILFKKGSFVRKFLKTVGGEVGKPVTYSSYGKGPKPIFCGSVDVSAPEKWEKVRENVWTLKDADVHNVGNFVFNGNECTAALRWEENELSSQGDFYDPDYGNNASPSGNVLLYSVGNPGDVYDSIEAVPFGNRRLAMLTSFLTLDGLEFINSGVHGVQGQGEGITVRNCSFRRIGGCVWSRDLHIRFGNAIEFWDKGNDVLIENCDIRDVYDSCITHQGGKEVIPAHNFTVRGCVFDTYGMAAFEYRDRMMIGGIFEKNICQNAGCGFAMLGETLPRKSEIWPQPMGHHIFLWRIGDAVENGKLEIINNLFGEAPVGAAIYSIISAKAEAQITLDNNVYTESNPSLLCRYGGENFADFDSFRKATKNEINGKVIKNV